jgi:hypothetical protein
MHGGENLYFELLFCTPTAANPCGGCIAGGAEWAGRLTRWQSSGLLVTGRRASTTRGPMVMLGTKRPSITSTCTQSQPAASMAATCTKRHAHIARRQQVVGWAVGVRNILQISLSPTCSPNFAKLADRIEGETCEASNGQQFRDGTILMGASQFAHPGLSLAVWHSLTIISLFLNTSTRLVAYTLTDCLAARLDIAPAAVNARVCVMVETILSAWLGLEDERRWKECRCVETSDCVIPGQNRRHPTTRAMHEAELAFDASHHMASFCRTNRTMEDALLTALPPLFLLI